MAKNHIWRLSALFCVLAAPTCLANPKPVYDAEGITTHLIPKHHSVVIHDSGNTVPISKWMDTERAQVSSDYGELTPAAIEAAAKAAMMPEDEAAKEIARGLFPLKPLKIRRAELPAPLIERDLYTVEQPLCVIGSDAWSREWLRLNKQAMLDIGTACILTESPSLAVYNEMKALASPLTLTPVPADFLVDAFQIDVYPLLITSKGFLQ